MGALASVSHGGCTSDGMSILGLGTYVHRSTVARTLKAFTSLGIPGRFLDGITAGRCVVEMWLDFISLAHKPPHGNSIV